MAREVRVLVICAHDDDEVIGAGGSIRRLADAGAYVSTLIFAEGNEGYSRLDQKDHIVRERRAERAEAKRILGTADYIVHDYHDFANLDSEAVYREIMRVVRLIRPQIVFGHLSADYLAHRTLAAVMPEAVWQAGWLCSLELGDPWRVDRLYQFPILELIQKPSHIVNITDTFEAKLQAMTAYHSQRQAVSGILDQIEPKARVYGSLIGVRYGEAFVRSQAIPIPVADPMQMVESLI